MGRTVVSQLGSGAGSDGEGSDANQSAGAGWLTRATMRWREAQARSVRLCSASAER